MLLKPVAWNPINNLIHTFRPRLFGIVIKESGFSFLIVVAVSKISRSKDSLVGFGIFLDTDTVVFLAALPAEDNRQKDARAVSWNKLLAVHRNKPGFGRIE